MSTGTRTYTVPDISCDHCNARSKTTSVPSTASKPCPVDVDAKTITGGNPHSIEIASEDAGYVIT